MNEFFISVSMEMGVMLGPVGVAIVGRLYSMITSSKRAAMGALARRCPLRGELDRCTQTLAILDRAIERNFDVVRSHDRGRRPRGIEQIRVLRRDAQARCIV